MPPPPPPPACGPGASMILFASANVKECLPPSPPPLPPLSPSLARASADTRSGSGSGARAHGCPDCNFCKPASHTSSLCRPCPST